MAISISQTASASSLIAYADTVDIVALDDVPSMGWSFRYGSNLAGGLNHAMAQLDGPGVIELITYSAPSAIVLDGNDYFDPDDVSGLIEATTTDAAQRCARAGIRINVSQIGIVAGDVPARVAAISGGNVTVTSLDGINDSA